MQLSGRQIDSNLIPTILMKRLFLKRCLTLPAGIAVLGGFALFSTSCGEKGTVPTETSGQPSSEPAAAKSETEVASALSGKIVHIENGNAVPAEITGDPEYFVLYHSASW